MNENLFFITLKVIALLACLLAGGFLFYGYIENLFSLNNLYIIPIFLLLTLIAFFIPSELRIKGLSNYKSSLIMLFLGFFIVFCLIYITFSVRNSSPIKYSVRYYNEEGIFIDFMESGRYRAKYAEMFNSHILYGQYEEIDDIIILRDHLKISDLYMNDTIKIVEQGLEFKLMHPLRYANRGILSFY